MKGSPAVSADVKIGMLDSEEIIKEFGLLTKDRENWGRGGTDRGKGNGG
jgi:hypothetical protein